MLTPNPARSDDNNGEKGSAGSFQLQARPLVINSGEARGKRERGSAWLELKALPAGGQIREAAAVKRRKKGKSCCGGVRSFDGVHLFSRLLSKLTQHRVVRFWGYKIVYLLERKNDYRIVTIELCTELPTYLECHQNQMHDPPIVYEGWYGLSSPIVTETDVTPSIIYEDRCMTLQFSMEANVMNGVFDYLRRHNDISKCLWRWMLNVVSDYNCKGDWKGYFHDEYCQNNTLTVTPNPARSDNNNGGKGSAASPIITFGEAAAVKRRKKGNPCSGGGRSSDVLKWGRCVYNNIQKFIQFQLTVNVAALVINFVAAVSAGEVPLTAVQLLWVNLIMDTLGALALATEKPTEELMKKKPVGRTAPLITNVMWRNLMAQALYQIAVLLTLQFKGESIFAVNKRVNDTLIFNTFVLCQVFNEFNARNLEKKNVFEGIHKNKLFMAIIGITLVLQVVMVEFLKKFANTERLNWGQWGICIGFAAASWPIGWLVKCISVPDRPIFSYLRFK
ncbi:argonaute family protein [Capsicum annuum]|nr:argonaute family protein [Capsicum annuum]